MKATTIRFPTETASALDSRTSKQELEYWPGRCSAWAESPNIRISPLSALALTAVAISGDSPSDRSPWAAAPQHSRSNAVTEADSYDAAA